MIEDVKMNKKEVINDLDDILNVLWDIDIPSPTVPEYIEHHDQVQSVMKYVGKKIDKYKNKKFNLFECPWCHKEFYLEVGEEFHFCPKCGWRGITLMEDVSDE